MSTTQATIAKTVRANRKTASANKPAPKAADAIKYAVADFARPTAGAALAAHTHAFLTLSGIAEGKPYPKAKAVQVLGARAVGYHLREKENFRQTDEGLLLTEKGELFFIHRGQADAELVKAYSEVLTKGAVNAAANVKTEAARVAIK